MKKLFSFLMMTVFAVAAYAQGPVSIEGEWGYPVSPGLSLNLYKVENANINKVASATPAEDGKFYFTVAIKNEGFYAIGGEGLTLPNYVFYFKPGDKLNVKFSSYTYELKGKDNSPENLEIEKWHNFILPIEQSAYKLGDLRRYTFVEFFPLLEGKAQDMTKYKAGKTKNPVFDAAFARYREINFADNALYFLFRPNVAHPNNDELSDYYRNLDVAELTKDEALLNYPDGLEVIVRSAFIKGRINEGTPPQNMEVAVLQNTPIGNDKLKGEFVAKFSHNKKSYTGMLDYEKEYSKYLVTERQRKIVETQKNKLFQESTKRENAVDFTFPDQEGNMVSLSDFKGKVVYVDVWATWCGPCKGEIPHLIKLEEEYHDNPNIVFMSVSIDKDKSKAVWEKFIKDEGLGGIQLFTGDDNRPIMEPYGITGIPRFLLIDKEGKLASINAVRPSSPEVRSILNSEIAR